MGIVTTVPFRLVKTGYWPIEYRRLCLICAWPSLRVSSPQDRTTRHQLQAMESLILLRIVLRVWGHEFGDVLRSINFACVDRPTVAAILGFIKDFFD